MDYQIMDNGKCLQSMFEKNDCKNFCLIIATSMPVAHIRNTNEQTINWKNNKKSTKNCKFEIKKTESI